MNAASGVPLREERYQFDTPEQAQRFTVGLMAKAIREGRSYPPIRNLAAAVASRAAPKDYLGQVREIYNDFLGRWRYVKDPVGVEYVTASPRAMWHLVLSGDGRGVGDGRGAEDCESAAAAIGTELAAIGMPVRIATTRHPIASRGPFSHTFVQAKVPGHGWLSVDPVGHPHHGLGWTPPHNAFALWDIEGQQIAGDRLLGGTEGDSMQQYNGFGALGRSDQYQWKEYPLNLETGTPLPFDVYGLAGFGCYVDQLGYCGDGRGYMVEVDEDNQVGDSEAVRTPILELQPGAFALVKKHGIVLDGTMALGDDGAIYEYNGLEGFFSKIGKGIKKIGKGIKKGVKKVGSAIRSGTRKVFKATKFGRAIIKLKNRIVSVAMKIVNPIMKVIGKWAMRIAPIAAMIPGIGPVLAGYLTAAGTIAKAYNKYGVKIVEFMAPRKGGGVAKQTKIIGKPKDILAAQREMIVQAEFAKRIPPAELERKAKMMRKYKGKELPTSPIWEAKKPGARKKMVIRKGTPEWRAVMKAQGLKRGAFSPELEPKKVSRRKPSRKKKAPVKARVVARAPVQIPGAAPVAQPGQAQMIKAAKQAARKATRQEFRRMQRRAA